MISLCSLHDIITYRFFTVHLYGQTVRYGICNDGSAEPIWWEKTIGKLLTWCFPFLCAYSAILVSATKPGFCIVYKVVQRRRKKSASHMGKLSRLMCAFAGIQQHRRDERAWLLQLLIASSRVQNKAGEWHGYVPASQHIEMSVKSRCFPRLEMCMCLL